MAASQDANALVAHADDQAPSSSPTFHRPPREHPEAVPSEPMSLAAPPTVAHDVGGSLMQALFPVIGSVSLLAFALVYRNKLFLYIAIALVGASILFGIGLRWSQRRSARKKLAADRRRYRDYLTQRGQELTRAGELQRKALARLFPDAGRLWTLMLQRRQLWERRATDEDFLHVRIGRGTVDLDQPVKLDAGFSPLTEFDEDTLREAQEMVDELATLRQQPVVVDLAEVGVVSVTGDAERSRAILRSLLCQLAAFRAPQDLCMAVAFPADASHQWEWLKWLPHTRGDRDAPVEEGGQAAPALLMAHSADELGRILEELVQPRLEQLRRIAESDLSARGVTLLAPQLVLVVDGFQPTGPIARLPLFREILLRARELKVTLLLRVNARDEEPSDIDGRINVPVRAPLSFERSGPNAPRIEGVWSDEVDLGAAEAIARSLAPLRLEQTGEELNLSQNVRLLDLLGVASPDELDVEALWASRGGTERLRAPIGVRADGMPVVLDLKESAEDGMGPHGLLVGATGSGKSELLRTLVTGLALLHDPEEVSFVLVDYKGGAAFAQLARLPHVAGVITNLQRDLSLVDRMHEALRGEQERRQALLRDAGDVDDIRDYEARRRQNPDLPPLPYLLVIVDEFAELLASRPEFIDLFVALGRVGRSLGIHLLLASQRLDEGRLRGLESHLRYRICLRTYSSVESKTVLGTPDAYLLPPLPGLGYLKVDTAVYDEFKAALVSSPRREPPRPTRPEAEVRPFAVGPPQHTTLPAGDGAPGAPAPGETGRPVTDLDLLVTAMESNEQTGKAVHQVWMPPLEPVQPLDAVLGHDGWWTAPGEDRREPPQGILRVPIGTVDRPAEQRTEHLVLDFSGAAGHMAIVGAPQTGKSTLLRTIVSALTWTHTPDQVQFYAIDLGGGLLRPLEAAPHVGGVCGKADRDVTARVVRQLQAEVERRELIFRNERVDSIAEVRARRARGDDVAEELADIFLLVDGWATFRHDFEDLEREVETLAAAGLSYGIHMIVTANRWAEIRPNLLDNLGTRLELRLNDPIDSLVGRHAAAALPDVAGRGLIPSGHHFQAAVPRMDGRPDAAGLGEAVAEAVAQGGEHWTGAPAPPIRVLPLEVAPDTLTGRLGESTRGVPLGIEELRLEPVTLDFEGEDPHLLVFGDAEAGKTSVLRAILAGLAGSPDRAQALIVDLRRSLIDAADGPHITGYAASAAMAEDALSRLAADLSERLPSAEASREELLAGPRWAGPHYYVVIDDYDIVASTAVNPLTPLLHLLPHGRDVGLHVVLARRVGGSTRSGFEPVFQRLRELSSPGLIMSGDRTEGPLIANQRAESLPPGRGYLVRRNHPTTLVQTVHYRPLDPSAAPVGSRSGSTNGGGAGARAI